MALIPRKCGNEAVNNQMRNNQAKSPASRNKTVVFTTAGLIVLGQVLSDGRSTAEAAPQKRAPVTAGMTAAPVMPNTRTTCVGVNCVSGRNELMAGCQTKALLEEVANYRSSGAKQKFEAMFLSHDCVALSPETTYKILSVADGAVEYVDAKNADDASAKHWWGSAEAFGPEKSPANDHANTPRPRTSWIPPQPVLKAGMKVVPVAGQLMASCKSQEKLFETLGRWAAGDLPTGKAANLGADCTAISEHGKYRIVSVRDGVFADGTVKFADLGTGAESWAASASFEEIKAPAGEAASAAGQIKVCKNTSTRSQRQYWSTELPSGPYTGACDKQGQHCRSGITISAAAAILDAAGDACVIVDATLTDSDGKPLKAGDEVRPLFVVQGQDIEAKVVTPFASAANKAGEQDVARRKK